MDLASISIEILVILFFVAIAAGFLDTLAGGGGLITIPALMMAGVPPLAALGTNKFQSCVGTATATLMMFKTRNISWNNVKWLMFLAFVGSVVGTIAVQFIDAHLLTFVVPIVLLIIALYFIFSPKPSESLTPKISDASYHKYVIPTIGFYDGMFGPGTGSFFALAGVSCRGYGLVKSTAIAKSLNFSTNFASLLVFLIAGKIIWLMGVVMMAGQFAGAWLGSHCLVKMNPKYLRLLVVTMCLSMLIKYSHTMGWW